MSGPIEPPRRARRKRIVDTIWVGADDDTFSPEAWAEDFRERLDDVAAHFGRLPINDFNDRKRLAALLSWVVNYMMKHPGLRPAEGIEDLALLRLALKGLNLGRVHPLVAKGEGLGMGAPISPAEREFRAHVLAATQILSDSGIEDHDTVVAGYLYDEGFRGQKTRDDFPSSTITNWRSTIMKSESEVDADEIMHRYIQFRNTEPWPPTPEAARELAREIIGHPWLKLLKPPNGPAR